MAGRGRGATLPAWMTSGDAAGNNSAIAQQSIDFSSKQFQDAYAEHRNNGSDRDHGKEHSSRHGDNHGERSNREDRNDRKVKRSRSRSREKERPSGRDRRGRSSSPKERTSSNWKPRKKNSNFDVRPADGVELPPIGVITPVNGVPNSYYSFTNNPLGILKDTPTTEVTQQIDTSLHTRHARRIYAGGIPPTVTENEIVSFFNGVLYKATPPGTFTSPPAIKAYINVEKCYAFVEFTSMELATACMEFDGIRFEHHTGTHIFRIRRPNDYRPELVPKLGPLPRINTDFLATLGASGATASGGKIFVGGIPYGISDEQIVELLSAFGPVKTFHQIRDTTTNQTKGYGFCEYLSSEVADAAILGLNGMPLRDKVLTVRYATQNQLQGAGGGGGGTTATYGGGNNMIAIPGQNQGMYVPPSTHVTLPAPSFNFQHSAIAQNTLANSIPSRVLKLSNMVTHDDLSNDQEYEEIKEDVRLECEDHGQVLSVTIPRLKDGYPASTEGHIYVEFAVTECAKMAAVALNGRKFADRTVVVQYFDELKYASRMFI